MNTISLLKIVSEADIETTINSFNINLVLIASLILAVLLLTSAKVVKNKKLKKFKKPLFILIVVTIAIPTLFMSGSSVYINTISDSKGPVHWHTDIEFWVCGEEIELRDPTSALSNKIGTSTYHEHDDKRIHLEGVVVDLDVDAGLEKFMRVTDGEISENKLTIATNETIFEDDLDGDQVSNKKDIVREFLTRNEEGLAQISVQNGMQCGNDPSQATTYTQGEVQTFVYTFNKDNDTYSQKKLDNPSIYNMRDESVVPPGDCVIVEFDIPKDKTDKLCEQYGVKDIKRCVEFGVSEFNPKVCKYSEVDNNEYSEINPTRNIQSYPDGRPIHSDPNIEESRLNCEKSSNINELSETEECSNYLNLILENTEASREREMWLLNDPVEEEMQ